MLRDDGEMKGATVDARGEREPRGLIDGNRVARGDSHHVRARGWNTEDFGFGAQGTTKRTNERTARPMEQCGARGEGFLDERMQAAQN